MSKNLKIRNLGAGPMVLALTLSTSIAMFGCTTNRNLGDGDPVVTPGIRTMPTSNVGGSESAPANPPMTSSSSMEMRSAPPPMSAAEAAALLVDSLPRVQVLGPSSPDAGDRDYVSEGLVTGQFVNPALETNPALTVNSSISSQPVAAVTSGMGGAVATSGTVLVGGTTGAIVGGGMTGAATIAGVSNGSMSDAAFAPVVTNLGPAPVATSGLGVGGNVTTLSNAAPAPITSAVGVPVVTTIGATSITPTTASRTATATRRLNTRTTTTTTSGDVRIVRDAEGRVVVTNSGND